MKKMKIEKQLIFADQVQQVNSLKVSEHLNYRHEEDGIRAMGPLYIEGEYTGTDGAEKFREALEMDVLAPNHKLNGEPFSLNIEDYQANANGDTIQVSITLAIQGIADEQAVNQEQPQQKVSQETAVSAPKLTSSLTQQSEKQVMKTSEKVPEQPIQSDIEDQSENGKENTAVDDFNDLFQDTESTYTSYRIIVAKPNDTYATIANRCEVDEQQLRDTNKNKEIAAKTPVILPFQ